MSEDSGFSNYGGWMGGEGFGDDSLVYQRVENKVKETSVLFSRWVLGGENLTLIMPI